MRTDLTNMKLSPDVQRPLNPNNGAERAAGEEN
jgi:hypothetical protein